MSNPLRLQSHKACQICETALKTNIIKALQQRQASLLFKNKSWLIFHVPTCISDYSLQFNLKGHNVEYNTLSLS